MLKKLKKLLIDVVSLYRKPNPILITQISKTDYTEKAYHGDLPTGRQARKYRNTEKDVSVKFSEIQWLNYRTDSQNGGMIMLNKKSFGKRGGARLFNRGVVARQSSANVNWKWLGLSLRAIDEAISKFFDLVVAELAPNLIRGFNLRNIRKPAKCGIAATIVLLSAICYLLSATCLYAASDIKAKLNTADGTSTFGIQDSGEATVATVDSDGSMVLEGSVTVKSGGIILQGASPYVKRGVNNDQMRIAGASDSTDGGCIELYGKDNVSSGTVKIIYGDSTAPGSASDAGIVEFLYRTDASWIQKLRVDYEGTLTISSNIYVGSSDNEYLGLSNGDLSLVSKHSGWMRFITAGGSFHWFVDGDAESSDEAMTLNVDKKLYLGQDTRYMWDNDSATEFSGDVRVYGLITSSSVNISSAVFTPGSATDAASEGTLYYDSTAGQLKLYDNSAAWVQLGTGPVVAGGGDGTDADCRTSTGTLRDETMTSTTTIMSVLNAVALDTGTYATSPTTHSFIVTNNLEVHGNEIKDSDGYSRFILGDTTILASSVSITGDVIVGTNTPSAGQGSVKLTMDGEVEGYWENDEFPRYQLDRDMGGIGSGKAGIGFGPGGTAIDLKLYREDGNTVIIKGAGTPDNNMIRRADNLGKLTFASGTGTDSGASLELFGKEYAGAGDVGRARIIVTRNSVGFDIMVADPWETILTLDTTGNMILDGNFTSNGVKTSTAVFTPASAPDDPAEGMVYYDSTDGQLKLYDNSAAWVQLGTGTVAAGGGDGTDADCRTSTGTLAVSVSADTSTLSGLFSALDTEVDADTTTLRGLVYDVGVSTGEIAGTYATSPTTHSFIVTDDLTVIGNDIKDSGGTSRITLGSNMLFTTTISTFSGASAGATVSGGVVYISNNNTTANRTILGLDSGGTEKFRFDNDGDLEIANNLFLEGSTKGMYYGTAITAPGLSYTEATTYRIECSTNLKVAGTLALGQNTILNSGNATILTIATSVTKPTTFYSYLLIRDNTEAGAATTDDAYIMSADNMYLDLDADGGSTSGLYVRNGAKTEVAVLDESGNLQIDGNMTSAGVNTSTAVFVPASAPDDAAEGMVYYDSTDGQLKLYDNSVGWVQIGTGPVTAGGGDGTDADCRTSTGTLRDETMTSTTTIMSILSELATSTSTIATSTGTLAVAVDVSADTNTLQGLYDTLAISTGTLAISTGTIQTQLDAVVLDTGTYATSPTTHSFIVTDDLIVNGDDVVGSAGTKITFSTVGDTVTVSGDLKLGAATSMVYKTNGDKALQFETSNTHLYTKDDGWFTLRRTSDDAERFKIDSDGYMHLVGNIIKDSASNNQITFTAGSLAAFGYDIKVTGNDIQNSEGEATITMDADQNVTIAGKVYLTNTNQYIYSFGGSDIALVDEGANWMRFSTAGSEFHWFADGTTMSDSKMTLEADGDLLIDGDITVTGNDIKDSGGVAAITFDGSQNVTVAGNLTVTGSNRAKYAP